MLFLSIFNIFPTAEVTLALNGKINVNDELQRLLNVTAVSYFNVLSQHLSAGSEENYRNLQSR
jgi:hypothetical protein